jgi:RNA-directed DNA polymerase
MGPASTTDDDMAPWVADVEAFKAVTSQSELAQVLGLSRSELQHFAYGKGRRYKSFTIPKKRGGNREIDAPEQGLKRIQRRIAELLALIHTPRRCVHGFMPGGSIVKNARAHYYYAAPKAHRPRHAHVSSWVLNVDLLDFFPTIHFGRVRGLFQARPFRFPLDVAKILSALCVRSFPMTGNGPLPQGAPTSPVLSNMICSSLDNQLDAFARSNGLRYTRYADDITLSTRARQGFPSSVVTMQTRARLHPRAELGAELVKILTRHRFSVNESKVRLFGPNARKEVTGLTVGSNGPNVPRAFVRDLRALICDYSKDKLGASERFASRFDFKSGSRTAVPPLDHVIAGKLSFLRMVKGPEDAVYRRMMNRWLASIGDGRSTRQVQVRAKSEWRRAIWRVVTPNGTGSGFALGDRPDRLVTAHHVIAPAEVGNWVTIENVTLRVQTKAEVIWFSEKQDLALLRSLDPVQEGFTFATAESRSGDCVYVCGHPEGEDWIDMTKTRVKNARKTLGTHQQVATVEGGCLWGMSGGPVLSPDGFVVGVIHKGLSEDVEHDHTVQHMFVLPVDLPLE